MNYMTEITMFYDWLLYNPLPTGAIALWNALMSINNKAGWADEFTVANIVLQGITGLSRQGLDGARNTLIQKGLILYKKGTSNQAGKYKIISFDSKKTGTVADTVVGTAVDTKPTKKSLECKKTGTKPDTEQSQDHTQDSHGTSTLNKLNETKQDIINKSINTDSESLANPDLKRVFDMWQSNIGIPSAIETKKIFEWVDDLSADVVCYAIENVATLDYSKRNYRYINGILNNWAKDSLKTVEDIKAYELTHQQKNLKQNKPNSKPLVKQTTFNSVQGRDWDFNELERLQRERIKQQLEVIDGASGAS